MSIDNSSLLVKKVEKEYTKIKYEFFKYFSFISAGAVNQFESRFYSHVCVISDFFISLRRLYKFTYFSAVNINNTDYSFIYRTVTGLHLFTR